MKRIPIAGPWITQREIDYVTDAVTTAWYENSNKYNSRFEEAFAKYVGRKFALATPSCTAAIHAALASLKIGPGDEVIVPDITWIASSAPISYVGATTIFADVLPDTWCLSPASLEACITPRTRAIIPVDLYGSMPDMEAIGRIATKHGVAIIEDSAEAIGSTFHGKHAGAFGDCSVFSFHGTKTLTTGEGGMFVTDDEELYMRAVRFRDHGRDVRAEKMFWNTEIGQKYRMSSLQAALGLAQLERIDELVARKREIFGFYREGLKGIPGLTLNAEPPNTVNSYWMVTIVLDPKYKMPKEALMRELAPHGVDARPFFYPLSSLPAYSASRDAARARETNVVSYAISPYAINLPSASSITAEDALTVCRALRTVLGAS